MSPAKFELKVEGVRKLLKKLGADDPVHAQVWTDALNEATEIAYKSAVDRAPKLTGNLAGSITRTLQKKPVPLWGRVKFPNKAKPGGKRGKGFRYGGALEGGGRYHYRSGPFAGQKTKSWFSGSLQAAIDQINPILKKAKREIEARWNRD